jgi:hypothetical protein
VKMSSPASNHKPASECMARSITITNPNIKLGKVLINALTAEVGTMRNLPGVPEGNVCGLWGQIKS